MTTTVADLISNQTAAVDSTMSQVQAYLDRLVGETAINFGAIPFTVDSILTNQYLYPDVPALDADIEDTERPDRPDFDLSDTEAPQVPTVDFSDIDSIDMPVDNLTVPTREFSFYEAAYESTLLDPLKAKLLSDLQNGGYGIDTTDEVALFNRARDREVEAMLSKIEDAGRAMAMRGFPLPPGELSIHVDRAYQDMQDKVSSASRDITLERSKLFVENRQFTIREVKELENILIGFHNSVQERALNVARAAVELGVAFFNATLETYRARLSAAKARSDVQIQTLQAYTEQAKAKLELFRGEVSLFEAKVRAMLTRTQAQSDVFRADVDLYRTDVQRATASADLQVKAHDSVVRFATLQESMAVDNARVKLEAAIAALRFRADAAKFGADKFMALLTAMEGTVNTLAVQSATDA